MHVVVHQPTDWWASGAAIAVAVLTGGLALATYLMARATSSEVRLERRRMDDAVRPHVYPQTHANWVDQSANYAQDRWVYVIPVTNAGPGTALNVRGRFRLRNGTFMTLLPTSLYPAQTLDVRIDWGGSQPIMDGWADAHGYLIYEDTSGATWRTDYFIRESNQRKYFEFEKTLRWNRDTEPLDEFQIVGVTRGLLG